MSAENGWDEHSPYHWSRTLFGLRLDYWPTKKKWRYQGKTHTGNVWKFIKDEAAKRHAFRPSSPPLNVQVKP